jgi:molecular chaperone Hsp33
VFAILIDSGEGTPYQGITPIAGGSLADCAETYFAQSEQLPTRFALAMGEAQEPGGPARWRGGGIMLQHMPVAAPHAREATGPGGLLAPADVLHGAQAETWRRAVTLLGTVEATELVGPHVGAEALLLRLFHEEAPRVFRPQPVRFGCTCGPEKVVQSLSIYAADEIRGMTTPEGLVTADCQFCGAHYEFDPAELGREAGSA